MRWPLLEAALDALVHSGQCELLEIGGEPGIGKSRLLAELAVRADARGYVVLSGRAAELAQRYEMGRVDREPGGL